MTAVIPISASEHPVKSVTIFKSANLAEVVRTFELELKPGPTRIEITGLPSVLDPESVRVTGLGTGTLRLHDVVCTTSTKDTLVGAEHAVASMNTKDFLDNIPASMDSSERIRLLKAHLKTLESEKHVREHESELLVAYARTLQGEHIKPEQMSAFLSSFVETGQKSLVAVREIEEMMIAVRRSIEQEEQKLEKRKGTARAKVDVLIGNGEKDSGETRRVELKLTYIVSNAKWEPTYELHAHTSPTTGQPSTQVTLHYRASIVQSTGEDWTDAALTLSTGSSVGGLFNGFSARMPILQGVKIKPTSKSSGFSLFGNAKLSSNANTASSGLFGNAGNTGNNTNTISNSIFGQQSSMGQSNSFGHPATNSTSAFGSSLPTAQYSFGPGSATTGGAFGSFAPTPQPSFGSGSALPTVQHSFGSGSATFGGAFGSSASGGLFGSATQLASAGGSGFGGGAASQPTHSGPTAFGGSAMPQPPTTASTTHPLPVSSFGPSPPPQLASGDSFIEDFEEIAIADPNRHIEVVDVPLSQTQTAVTKTAITISYSVKGLVSIPSDGVKHHVGVAVLPFGSDSKDKEESGKEDVKIEYGVVPRVDARVYLQCRVKNASEYTLLPGPVAVILNDIYVARTNISYVSPNRFFTCTLGSDSTTSVTYSRKSKSVDSSAGSFAESFKITTYTTTVTLYNRHAFDLKDVRVWDAVPMWTPTNDADKSRVTVVLRKPLGLADAKDGQAVSVKDTDGKERENVKAVWDKEKEGKFYWKVGVQAGKSEEFVLEWEVKAPADLSLVESYGNSLFS